VRRTACPSHATRCAHWFMCPPSPHHQHCILRIQRRIPLHAGKRSAAICLLQAGLSDSRGDQSRSSSTHYRPELLPTRTGTGRRPESSRLGSWLWRILWQTPTPIPVQQGIKPHQDQSVDGENLHQPQHQTANHLLHRLSLPPPNALADLPPPTSRSRCVSRCWRSESRGVDAGYTAIQTPNVSGRASVNAQARHRLNNGHCSRQKPVQARVMPRQGDRGSKFSLVPCRPAGRIADWAQTSAETGFRLFRCPQGSANQTIPRNMPEPPCCPVRAEFTGA
jgi:hypothetical protein